MDPATLWVKISIMLGAWVSLDALLVLWAHWHFKDLPPCD